MNPAIEVMLTMRPLLRAIMCGIACLAQRNAPVTFTASVRSQSARSMSTTRSVGPPTPALLTRMSSPPSSASVAATTDFTAASSATSASAVATRPPALRISAAVASSVSRRVAASITAAPSETKRSAIARPMPRPPPVMSATLPLSRFTGGNLARAIPAALLGPRRARHGAFPRLPLHHHHRGEDQPRAQPPPRLEALGAQRHREHQRKHRLEREQEPHAADRKRALRIHLEQRRERAAREQQVREAGKVLAAERGTSVGGGRRERQQH